VLIALFSDIHANREAFDACLGDARRRGAEQFVFLGDLVGYGADPSYVVDRVAQMRSEGALVIKGNHDAAIDNGQQNMNRHAQLAIDWTRRQLDDAQRQFLVNLPLMVSLGELLFVHAEASHPAQWTYISRLVDAERSMQATEMRVTVSGHIHRPHLFHMAAQKPAICFIPTTDVPILLVKSHKWHAIIGSVGQPRDEMASAAYALYDDRSGLLTFVRSTYDIERAARKIKQAGLPAVLAARLYVGR
jgi:diadenosine tetraphosphatase ApaH/serine/threonine PP2A family protein phosphatase